MTDPRPVWEQRWHPLREEWVVLATHRDQRPWRGGRLQAQQGPATPSYDPTCHFCPGNPRIGGVNNPRYAQTLVFDNDHPCFGADAPTDLAQPPGIYANRAASGVSRIVCYTPRHDLSLAELEPDEVVACLEVLQQQYLELGDRADIDHVLMFENRGEAAGVSNPHPHCQIYASNFVFKTILDEADVSRRHLAETGRLLFVDILTAEREDGQRVLFENDAAIAFVPYFARYPYEVYVAPKRTHASLAALAAAELRDFAAALQHTLIKFDNLWAMPFPYVMPLHQAPTDGGDHDGFHFHVELHPPLRAPDLKKYPAGPEIGGGNYMRDNAPEQTAAELRAAPDVHYKTAEADQ